MRLCHLVLVVYCPLGHAAPLPPAIGGAPIVDAVKGATDTRFLKLGEENAAAEKLSPGLQLDTVRPAKGDSTPNSLTSDEELFHPKPQVDMLVNSRLGSKVNPAHVATTGTISKHQAPMVYFDEFLEEASEITDESIWQKLFGPVSKAFENWRKPPIKEVPGYDPEWLSKKQLRGLVKPENLARFRDKIGGMDQGHNALIKVDPRDPAPLEKMMLEDFQTFSAAREYYKQLLGSAEFERRMKVSSGQYDQLRIMKGSLKEAEKISAQLKMPQFQVKQAGNLFGANKFFTSFEDMDRGQTLAKINAMRDHQPALYNKWKTFIGPEEFERRLSLLRTLNELGNIKIPPKQLSAWQMQGLDVNRMVTVWAHSQPQVVSGKKFSRVQSVIWKDSKPLKKEEYRLFWGKTDSGEPWEKSLEHDQLQRVAEGAENYQMARKLVREASAKRVRTPASNNLLALVGQEGAMMGQNRALVTQESLRLSQPGKGNLGQIWKNFKPTRVLRGDIGRVLNVMNKLRGKFTPKSLPHYVQS